jgi:hypothetical protein
MKAMVRRRICWPQFDVVCLQGGCSYCNENRMRSLNTIRDLAERDPKLQAAYWDGYDHQFYNAEVEWSE